MKPVALAALAVSSLALNTAGSDWNQWRGPQRDGIARDFPAPAAWSADSLAKQWTVAVGEGHSSPVVVGERAYVFTREGDAEILRCLSLDDGRVVWRSEYPAPYEMNPAARAHGKGPKSTPTVIQGRVFTLGIDGHVSAYDAASGRVLWRKSFSGEYKSTSPAFGAAASPLVDGDNVIVHVGGRDDGALTAFDVRTGQVVWRWTGDGPAYASPVIATLGGVRQLITQSQAHCLAVAPADGRLLWQVPFTTPYEQNIITPVVAGDLVIFAGVGKPTFAVRVQGAAVETVWEVRDLTMYMSTPVLNGSSLHGMSDKQRGTLFTLDVATGAVRWRSDGRQGANASLTDVGSALLIVTVEGELSVRQKGPGELKELAKYKVADTPVWASPALAGDRLLVKDKANLTLFRVRGGRGSALTPASR